MMLTKKLCCSYFTEIDGVLFWNHRKDVPNKWNAKWAGKAAGWKTSTGYISVTFNGKHHRAHRIIFLMHHGWIPEEVEHVNNIRTDNRIENLRAADSTKNKQNTMLLSSNTSGIKGVSLHKPSGKWRCSMSIKNKVKQVFGFDSKEDAADFMELWRVTMHGEFANHGTRRLTGIC